MTPLRKIKDQILADAGVVIDQFGNCVMYKKMCSVTNEPYVVEVDAEKHEQWKTSALLIQDAFPELTDDQREFILSGMTPAEWDKAFSED